MLTVRVRVAPQRRIRPLICGALKVPENLTPKVLIPLQKISEISQGYSSWGFTSIPALFQYITKSDSVL